MDHWQVHGFSSLRIENWDGEFTVFQPESGKTHFLNEMGLQVLIMLGQSPVTLEGLCQKLSEYFTLLPDTQFPEQIARTLQRFEALGLIVRVKESA
ncbi:HPr-rel-A system PqqD family peptide chaperone [Nitrosomonas sp.]|uniref:HPr-rel-A system PqqD family peptide chaperone n=1 Tax=Nitrosomonas sp. TaxID=42353 RepID=UPI0025E155F2|nr:HPr-rel-A system PqqD family peptide chaperone [Nitrosomonas sp.]MCC6917183.1 HPr-rel-A system PqqD family peptide chaperone [Nitrosomonas sp.]